MYERSRTHRFSDGDLVATASSKVSLRTYFILHKRDAPAAHKSLTCGFVVGLAGFEPTTS